MNIHKNSYRSFKQLLGAVLTYSIGSFYFGYSMGYFNSFDFKEIHRIFNIQMQQKKAEGIFSGCLPFGALFGAYFSRIIINKFSRRHSFFITDGLAILAGIIVLIPAPQFLVVGRFLQGFCVGLFSSLVPIMIKEYSPIQLSGSFGALLAPGIGCGFFSAYLLSYILTRKYELSQVWVLIFGFPLIMILLQLLLIQKIYKNQTPKYLICQGRIQEAKVLIQQIYKQQFVELILNQKIADNKTKDNNNYQLTSIVQKDPQSFEQENQKKPSPMNQQQNGIQKQSKNIEQLQLNKKATPTQVYPSDITLAKLFAYLLQAFHQLSGINVIVVYGAHLAQKALPQLKNEIPLIINGQKILAGLVGTLLLKKYGRRFLMLRGIGVIIFSLLGLFIGFFVQLPDSQGVQVLIIICLIMFVSSFVITLGPITWLYIPEIVQPPTVPYITIINWVLACLIITVFPMVKDYTSLIFLFFFGISVVNFVMCYFLMVETKGKNEKQIRKQFRIKQNYWKGQQRNRSPQQKQSQI